MAAHFQIEVCVDRIDHALRAVDAGATRIEMNSALACSGLTPSLASCRWLAQNCCVPVVAMLRPHDDGFVYSATEKDVILKDCSILLESGMAGIVFGALRSDGRIDVEFTSQLVELCGEHALIFHRAFDVLQNPFDGLTQLIDCGVKRVLTSGGAPCAAQGLEQLRALQELARERIEILPGAGVNASNAVEVVHYVGCGQIHGSFRTAASPNSPDASEIRAARVRLDAYAGLLDAEKDVP